MSLPSSFHKLTRREQLYVEGRLQGLSQIASATAAGYAKPKTDCSRVEKKEHVQQAMLDMMQKSADEVGFGRKEAHDMYMEAYHNAETAMEQIAAVNALVKLHGLEAPKQLEVKHQHTVDGEIRYLPTDELMRLADMSDTLVLDGEYEEVGEKPVLEPPEVTEDNTQDAEKLPNPRESYGT